MSRLKRIVIYLGVLLTILSVFVPIVSFDIMNETQSFSIMDNGFKGQILGGIIIALAALVLFLMTLKKYKFMFVPTFIDIILIIISINQIYNMEEIKLIEYKREIANILFPIGIIVTLFGEVLIVFSNKIDKFTKKHEEEKLIEKAIDNLGDVDSETEKQLIIAQENNDDFVGEQIPLDNLKRNAVPSKSFEPDVVDNVNMDNINENLLFDNEVHADLINSKLDTPYDVVESSDNITTFSNNIENNTTVENKVVDNLNAIENTTIDNNLNVVENTTIDNNLNVSENNVVENSENISGNFNEPSIKVSYSFASPSNETDDFAPQNVEMTNFYDDDDDDIEFLPDLDDDDINQMSESTSSDEDYDYEDEDIVFEEQVNNVIPDFSQPIVSDNYSDIPDVGGDNFMINNIQKHDEIAPQYMAFNPSDRVVNNTEEVIPNSTVDFANRNIIRLKNRYCSFCNTPLGDDERICPKCGRIN